MFVASIRVSPIDLLPMMKAGLTNIEVVVVDRTPFMTTVYSLESTPYGYGMKGFWATLGKRQQSGTNPDGSTDLLKLERSYPSRNRNIGKRNTVAKLTSPGNQTSWPDFYLFDWG